MATALGQTLHRELGSLRYEPTAKRVRARIAGVTAIDSTRAMLVWEPGRVVPSYAVPAEDITADLQPDPESPASSDAPILHPMIPFTVHRGEGEPVLLRWGSTHAHGYRLVDPDLAGYVELDFDGFEAWWEEDEPISGHPRDPFHRVDIRRSSRQVRISVDGRALAASDHATMVFETHLPVRFYLPREDVIVDLEPSPVSTTCAYKGDASYWYVEVDGRRRDDLLWSYEAPYPEATGLTGLVGFFGELVDIEVDGAPWGGVRTPVHDAILDEVATARSDPA